MNKNTWLPSPGFYNDPQTAMVLAHGAGAPADSASMEQLASALDGQGIANVRFEFPYMQQRRADGRKRPPGRQNGLLDSFGQAVERARAELPPHCHLLAGGKSMGGRMASLLAQNCGLLAAVACYGYPFHPPGRLDRWRIEHLTSVLCPLLIVQGSRDPFGKPAELADQAEALVDCELHWLKGGDHDFKPLVRQPESQLDLIHQAAQITRAFVDARITGFCWPGPQV